MNENEYSVLVFTGNFSNAAQIKELLEKAEIVPIIDPNELSIGSFSPDVVIHVYVETKDKDIAIQIVDKYKIEHGLAEPVEPEIKNVKIWDNIKLIFSAMTKEWSFYIYLLFNVIISITPLFPELKSKSLALTHFVVITLILLVDSIFLSILTYSVSEKIIRPNKISFGKYMSALTIHSLKIIPFFILLPIVCIIILSILVGLKIVSYDQTKNASNIQIFLVIVPTLIIIVSWFYTGFSSVIAKGNSKKSIFNSFNLLNTKLMKHILILYIIPTGWFLLSLPLHKIEQYWLEKIVEFISTLISCCITPLFYLYFAKVIVDLKLIDLNIADDKKL